MANTPDITTSIADRENWSQYVVWSIKELVAKVESQAGNLAKLQECMLRDLLKIKEDFRAEIDKNHTDSNIVLERAVDKIEVLIQNLSTRTTILEGCHPEYLIQQKLAELKENVLIPMRLKIAVLSASMGMVGGAVFLIVVDILKKVVVP